VFDPQAHRWMDDEVVEVRWLRPAELFHFDVILAR
jgi:hypothetical protein